MSKHLLGFVAGMLVAIAFGGSWFKETAASAGVTEAVMPWVVGCGSGVGLLLALGSLLAYMRGH